MGMGDDANSLTPGSRRRLERDQQMTRERHLIESVTDYAIFMLDPDGNVLSWNPGAERLKGYLPDEIIGSHFSRFYTQDALDRGWPQHELEVAGAEGRFEDEGWRVRKDGTHFWANVVITAMRDPDGALVGFAKVTRDLTERRRHEDALRESEERFRLLVESVQDYAIFMLDPDGIVMSWNLGAQRLKGYRPEEIIGSHFSRFYTADAVERGWPEHELVVARTEGRVEDEGWRVRKDGSRFWANVLITAVHDRQRVLRGYAKVTRDLTERRRVESLEEAGRQTDEFLAMLGHELRNPLAPIRNAVEVMRLRDSRDEPVNRARAIIDRQVSHLTRLVDDLLDVGRITTGKVALHRDTVDLAAIVTAGAEAAQPSMAAKHHAFEVHVGADGLLVDGDATRLTQVLMNLLNNAAKYTPEGGHVRLELDRDGAWAQLRVTDDGVGMPTELLPRVFDLFIQGQRSLARSEGGLGIGLTLVRRLVELHGGSVSASSRGPGQGSTFLVRLPLAGARRREQPTPVAPVATVPVRRKVLVVDDNRDAAEMLSMLIETWGYDVATVYDGPSAVELAERLRPDVVLLDIGLPGMNGYEVAARLRERVDPPVLIALTGYGQDDDKERGRDAGFAFYLVKPVVPARLEALLADVRPAAGG